MSRHDNPGLSGVARELIDGLGTSDPENREYRGGPTAVAPDADILWYALLSRKDVERLTRFSASTIRRMENTGEFPARLFVRGQARWRRGEILAWLRDTPSS